MQLQVVWCVGLREIEVNQEFLNISTFIIFCISVIYIRAIFMQAHCIFAYNRFWIHLKWLYAWYFVVNIHRPGLKPMVLTGFKRATNLKVSNFLSDSEKTSLLPLKFCPVKDDKNKQCF